MKGVERIMKNGNLDIHHDDKMISGTRWWTYWHLANVNSTDRLEATNIEIEESQIAS